jgi:putative PIN family toxin of toxin-antitoxin system
VVAQASRVKPPRVVLDTNVLVSALVFGGKRWHGLRDAWQSGRVVPLAGRATVDELLRVLCYPKFRLDDASRESLLAEFLPYADVVEVPGRIRGVPAVRDPDDARFLALALAGGADALVSGDGDLLSLRGKWTRVAILTPAEFEDWLETRQE